MRPLLTDQAVAGLPVAAGRAELLEEIMSTPVLRQTPTLDHGSLREGRGRRWLVPAGAAAAVALLALSSAWWPAAVDPGPAGVPLGDSSAGPAGPGPSTAAAVSAHRAVLDDPAWSMVLVERSTGEFGAVTYQRGEAVLEVSWHAGGSRVGFVEERARLAEAPGAGEPVTVLGVDALLWSEADLVHTIARGVQDGHWLQLEATGISRTALLTLAERLRLVDEAGFEAAVAGAEPVEERRWRTLQEVLDAQQARGGR